jgi:hypothetical protein
MRRAAVVAGLVVLLVLAGAGAGVAYWWATSNVSSTVTVGTFEATLGGVEQLDAVHTSASAPDIATLTLGVTGSGPVGAVLSTTSDNAELAAAIRLRTWVAPAGGCPTTVPQQGVTSSTLAVPALPPGVANLTAPATVAVCAATDVPSDYANHAGQQVAVRLKLTASLTASTWTASAEGSFVQQLQAATPQLICTDIADHSNVIISWSNPAGAPTSASYLVNVISPSGVVQSPGSASYWSTTLHVGAYLFPTAGAFTVEVLMFPDYSRTGPGTLIGIRTVQAFIPSGGSSVVVACG